MAIVNLAVAETLMAADQAAEPGAGMKGLAPVSAAEAKPPVVVAPIATAADQTMRNAKRFIGREGYTWSVQTSDAPYSLRIAGDEYRFELRPGDKWRNDHAPKTRAEISGLTVPAQGRSIIEYDVMIEDGDFSVDGVEHVIGQRHGKADKWDARGEHPDIALRILSGARLGLTVAGSPLDPLTKAEIAGVGKSRNPWTGSGGSAKVGVWRRIKIDALAAADGWVDLYVDGELMRADAADAHTYVGPFGYGECRRRLLEVRRLLRARNAGDGQNALPQHSADSLLAPPRSPGAAAT